MNTDTLSILNIDINNIFREDLLRDLKRGVVVTPNIDHMVKLQKDEAFYNIYRNAEYVILDSRVIQLLLKLSGKRIKEVIPGSELFPAYYNYHRDNPAIKIFLLGAMPGVAAKAMDRINRKLNRKIIVGAYSPSFGFEENIEENEQILDAIIASGANVLAIGVGAPKQEKWVEKYKKNLVDIDVYLCIGATIDFEAGNIRRAPKIFRILALEWFYRFLMEPKRLFRRYFIEDLYFFREYFKQLAGKYENPYK